MNCSLVARSLAVVCVAYAQLRRGSGLGGPKKKAPYKPAPVDPSGAKGVARAAGEPRALFSMPASSETPGPALLKKAKKIVAR